MTFVHLPLSSNHMLFPLSKNTSLPSSPAQLILILQDWVPVTTPLQGFLQPFTHPRVGTFPSSSHSPWCVHIYLSTVVHVTLL